MTSQAFILLADLILVAHTLLVGFVVLGFAAIVAGRWWHWQWIYRPIFRWLHLLLAIVIAAQALLGKYCPLTVWENSLRQAGGGANYQQSFVQYWLQQLLFFDGPLWIFAVIYTIFATVVVFMWRVDRNRGMR